MRQWMLGLAVAVVLGVSSPAEASIGGAVQKAWNYLFHPVNCVVGLGSAIVEDVIQFGYCVLGNANQNPVTAQPIFTGPEHADGAEH